MKSSCNSFEAALVCTCDPACGIPEAAQHEKKKGKVKTKATPKQEKVKASPKQVPEGFKNLACPRPRSPRRSLSQSLQGRPSRPRNLMRSLHMAWLSKLSMSSRSFQSFGSHIVPFD